MTKLPLHSFMVTLLLFLTGKAFSAETLYHLVSRSDWQTYTDGRYYRPLSLKTEGFIHLSTREQVIPSAQKYFKGEQDLLLLQLLIPTSDPLLKWETPPNGEASFPHYHGEIALSMVMDTRVIHPDQEGRFFFPKEPFRKKVTAQAIPKSVVRKFLRYQDWQKTDRFYQIQKDNFTKPKVQLQWWYFDFFLDDGSTVVLAFIPQLWWHVEGSSDLHYSHLSISLKTPVGVVKRFSTTFKPSELKASAQHLEIPGRFLIRSTGVGPDRTYSVQLRFPDLQGNFEITPTRPPFAAFPTGVMPGFLQTLISGAPKGTPSFSYTSQIPNGQVSGSLHWGDYQNSIQGQAYHEQGKQDDSPENQASYWSWYHFSGGGWNIFGSPSTYIYLQKGNQVIRSGFHLLSGDYYIQNRTFNSPDHAKILTGGEIIFHHENLSFRLKISPITSRTMIAMTSPDPGQVWGTVEGPAQLTVLESGKKTLIQGRMMLETCSWEKAKLSSK